MSVLCEHVSKDCNIFLHQVSNNLGVQIISTFRCKINSFWPHSFSQSGYQRQKVRDPCNKLLSSYNRAVIILSHVTHVSFKLMYNSAQWIVVLIEWNLCDHKVHNHEFDGLAIKTNSEVFTWMQRNQVINICFYMTNNPVIDYTFICFIVFLHNCQKTE